MSSNNFEMPHKPKDMLTIMEQEANKFEPFLGESSLIKNYAGPNISTLKKRYKNDKGASLKTVRKLFIDIGWHPRMKKYIDGEYEVYCKGFIHANYSKKNNTIEIWMRYAKGTPCFDAEYEKLRKQLYQVI